MSLVKDLIKQGVQDTGLHSGEAYVIWTDLQARYDTTKLLSLYYKIANDADFKLLINKGIREVVEPQIKKLEETAKKYEIKTPPRPPVEDTMPAATELFNDEDIYRIIFDASQTALLVHVKAINTCTNDSLRKIFKDFLIRELDLYDEFLKYGKMKGWVHYPPAFTQSK